MNLSAKLKLRPTPRLRKKITDYVGEDTERIKELTGLFLTAPNRLSQNAASVLICVFENYPGKAKPYLKEFIKAAQNLDAYPSIRRNIMRILQFTELPKNLQGQIYSLGYAFLNNNTEAVAVRVFAMSVLARIAKQWPDLSNELLQTIDRNLPYAKPAFLLRARKIKGELSRIR